MEGYGGSAQPSATIAQWLNGGYGWLEVKCHRYETKASIPLNAIRRRRNNPISKLEASLKCRSCRKGRYPPRGSHDQADGDAGDQPNVWCTPMRQTHNLVMGERDQSED